MHLIRYPWQSEVLLVRQFFTVIFLSTGFLRQTIFFFSFHVVLSPKNDIDCWCHRWHRRNPVLFHSVGLTFYFGASSEIMEKRHAGLIFETDAALYKVGKQSVWHIMEIFLTL